MLSVPRDLSTEHVAIIQKDNKIERAERIMFISNQNLKSKRPTTIEIVHISHFLLSITLYYYYSEHLQCTDLMHARYIHELGWQMFGGIFLVYNISFYSSLDMLKDDKNALGFDLLFFWGNKMLRSIYTIYMRAFCIAIR